MATQTTNYGLTKPSYGDNADIAVINSNMDKIDTKMKEIEDAGGGASTWAEVANKPFETVGSGLSVDESGALNATGGGSGGSSVSWNQIQTSGSKIAEVTIDGTKTDVYAPTGSSGGGGSVSTEILYTATGTSRTEIELSKPYTDFDYLDITILRYDDNSYYDFMHTFIDCARQADIMNNNLFTGRTNANILDIWATSNSFMRFKFTDTMHITYPLANGSNTIFQVKGIKFATSGSGSRTKQTLYTNSTASAQSIELSDSYKNYDLLIFRMIRIADGLDNYQDEKYYDKDWIEECQNSNNRIQFFAYTQWNTYQVADETHFDLINSASGVYVKEVIGVKF